MKVKLSNVGNRFLRIALSLLMVFSMVNFDGIQNVNAASTTTVNFIKEYAFIKSVKGFTTPNGFSRDSMGSDGTYIMSSTAGASGSGKVLYCIEPGVSLPGQSKGSYTTTATSMFKKNEVTSASTKKLLISYIGGRSNFVNTWDGDMAWKTKVRVLVAECLIWEVAGEYRNSSFNLAYSGRSLKNIYTFKDWTYNGTTYKAEDIKEYFDDIYTTWVSEIQSTIKELKGISFADGKSHAMIWDESISRFVYEDTDDNKVAPLFTREYDQEKTVWADVSDDGYTYTFKTYAAIKEIPKSSPVEVTFTGRTLKRTATVYGWIPSSSRQKFISLGEPSSSEITGTLKLYTVQPSKGTFTVKKVDEDGNSIQGAKFKITFPDKSVKEYTTNSSGLITVKDTNFGTYKVQETYVPDEYIIDTTVKSVTLDESNSNGEITYEAINKRKKGHIEINKTDSKDSTGISDVTFELRRKSDNALVDTLVTDNVGYAISKEIPLGKYYLVETDARNGVIVDPNYKDVELTEDTLIDGSYYKTVNLTNDTTNGSVTVYKKSEVVSSFDKETMKFTYEDAYIPDMKFKVTAIEDITDTRTGEIAYNKWDTVYEGTTGSDGTKTVSGLFPGKYTVVELEAPEGTVYDDSHHDFTIGPADNVTKELKASVTVTNKRQNIDVTVYKESSDGIPLAGAEYKVVASKDIKDIKGNTVVSAGTTVAKIETKLNADGSEAYGKAEDLPYGEYYVEEVKAPSGFKLDDSRHDVKVEFDQTIVTYSKELNLTDEYICGGITVKKYDPISNYNQVIPGVKIRLKAGEDIINPATGKIATIIRNGKEITLYKGTIIETVATDEEGIAEFDDLLPGVYAVQEIKGQKGYVMDSSVKTVTVTSDDTVDTGFKTVPIINESLPLVGRLKIVKKGENGEALAGAEFKIVAAEKITDPSGTVKVYYEEGVVVAEGIKTGSDGVATYYKKGDAPAIPSDYALHPGKYYVIETKAPDGYKLDPTPHLVNIEAPEEANEETIIDVDLEVVNGEIPTYFSKVELTTGEEVVGAKLKVIDTTNNTVVEEWVSQADDPETTEVDESIHVIKGLVDGRKYRFVESVAPYGFLKAADVEFTVDSTKDYQKIVMKDERVYGNIVVYKEGEVLTGYEDGKFVYENLPLAGAEFEITAKEDIKDVYTGEVIYAKGSVVGTIISDSEGYARLNNLPLGEYQVRETKAPDGTVLNGTLKDATLNYKDDETPVVVTNIEFNNEKQDVDLTVIKKDSDTKKVLEGAEFTLETAEDIKDYTGSKILVAKGTVLAKAVSDKNGVVDFGLDLPNGTYRAYETKAPVGYASNDKKITFDASYQGQDTKTVKLSEIFENDIITVEISKIDATDSVEIGGAKLQITEDGSDKIIEEWTSVQGESHIVKGLEVGKKYRLTETLAPYGYVLSDDVVFEIEDTGDIQSVVMKDELAVGQITIIKHGEIPVIFNEASELIGFENGEIIYKDALLSGVQFKVYAAEDIVAPSNGKILIEKGTLVDTVVTDEYGKALTKKLPLGTYAVKESKAPEGFVINKTEMTAKLEYADQITKVVYDAVSLVNERQSTHISVIKKDADTKEVLAGAEFTISAKYDIKNYLGDVIIPAGTDIETAVTGKDGIAKFTADLPLGIYEVRETKAPVGYASTDKIIEIDARAIESDKEVVVVVGEIENRITTIIISKVDITSEKELPGASLEVRDENNKVVDSWISEDTPHFIKGLEVGKTYTLIETKPADGYTTAEEIKFSISDTGDIQTVVMKDDITKVHVSKTDITGEKEIPGCRLEVTDSKGNIVDSWISGEEAHVITKLVVGEEYTLTETRPSDGYTTAESVKFTVKDTNEIQVVEMRDDTTKFSISKLDVTGSEEVEGALMQITDSKGNVVDEWTSTDEEHYIEGKLIVGETYTLTEVTAPEDYVRAESIEFTVEDSGKVQVVEMLDKVVEFIKTDVTGDNEVPGAEIEVTDKDGNVVDKWTSTEEPHYISGLKEGETYILTEVVAPDEYVIAESIEFTVSYDKVNQTVIMKDKQVDVSKVDVDSQYVVGAKLQIVDAETGDVVDEWVTEESIHYASNLIEDHSYILQEVETPKGYVKSADVEFTVTTDKENQSVVMVDKKVTVTKVDIANDEELPGAEIVVTDKETGEEVDRWISTEESHEVENLEEGKEYVLTEITAPEGYYKTESITFKVDSIDEEGIKIDQHYIMKDAPILTSIKVNKVDSATKEAIVDKDFEFTLYADKDCTQKIMTVSADKKNGCALFEGLRYGTYYVKETSAPAGYQLSSEIKEVIINDDTENVGGTYEFEYENILLPTKVMTGDNTNITMYTTMSVTGLLGLILLLSKKKKSEE